MFLLEHLRQTLNTPHDVPAGTLWKTSWSWRRSVGGSDSGDIVSSSHFGTVVPDLVAIEAVLTWLHPTFAILFTIMAPHID
jgi:hypothetical protein